MTTTPESSLADDVARAVEALTSAARRTYTTPTGEERYDFGESLTGVLTAVAANIGGVETLLAGRPGSWEAEGVRQLLVSALGEDESHLLEHRTEPVTLTLYVDELLVDQDVWAAYDAASQELGRRYEALGIPSVTGTPGDAATEAALAALVPATAQQELAADQIAELEDRLEQQRLADWAAYGQALKTAVEAAAARRPELYVPVVVTVDTDTYRPDRSSPWSDGLAYDLLAEALETTALPGGGQAPLDRLENPAGE